MELSDLHDEKLMDLVRHLRDPIKGVYMEAIVGNKVKQGFKGSSFIEKTCAFSNIDKALSREIGGHLIAKEFILPITSSKKLRLSDDAFYFWNFKKRVVVIGGGFAGRRLLRLLEKKGIYETVLITKHPYFESLPSLPSLIRNSDRIEKATASIRAPFSKYLTKTKVIVDTVSYVGEKYIELKSGRLVQDFQYLVLATGSYYDMNMISFISPTFKDELHKDEETIVINAASSKDLIDYHSDIEKSKKMVVIGGGPVGLEIYGELLTKYKDKQFILISSREILLERCCKASHDNVYKFCMSHPNSTVILGEHVKTIEGKSIYTSESNLVLHDVDICFAAIGFSPNTYFLQKSFLSKALDQRGFVKVNDYLQVEGLTTTFAMGDITNIDEEKLAQVAERHAEIVFKNIQKVDVHKSLSLYKPKIRPIFVSLGPSHSIFIHGQTVMMEGWMMSLVKHLIEYKMMK